MISEIMKGISVALNEAFGDGFEVYFSKDIWQGLFEPCFIITLAGTSRVRRIGMRYRQKNSFAVRYFPAQKGGNSEMMAVGERLFGALEFVRLSDGDLLHATAMKYSIQDGVLHFFVDFNMFLKKEPSLDDMETIRVDASITQGG